MSDGLVADGARERGGEGFIDRAGGQNSNGAAVAASSAFPPKRVVEKSRKRKPRGPKQPNPLSQLSKKRRGGGSEAGVSKPKKRREDGRRGTTSNFLWASQRYKALNYAVSFF